MTKIFAQIFEAPNQPFQAQYYSFLQALHPGEVLVAIEMATICGSDLHTINGQRQEPTPCILGHEAVGRIVQVDAKRPELSVGDRVTWTIADSCGVCSACVNHQLPQKCHSLFKYGHAALDDETGLNGCYASHIVLRAGTHIVKVPDVLQNKVIAPANCALATAVNAVSRLPDHCQSVVIQGAGLLGLYTCALLHTKGVPHIFCVDVQEHRLAQVAAFGGIPVNGQTEQYAQERQKIVSAAPNGVDAVLEVAGVAALIPEGIRLLRVGGYYGLVGMVHPNSQLEITGEQIIRKCLTFYGIHNYSPWHLDQAVQFLVDTVNRFPYQTLVSSPYPLSELANAIDEAQSQTWFRVSIQGE